VHLGLSAPAPAPLLRPEVAALQGPPPPARGFARRPADAPAEPVRRCTPGYAVSVPCSKKCPWQWLCLAEDGDEDGAYGGWLRRGRPAASGPWPATASRALPRAAAAQAGPAERPSGSGWASRGCLWARVAMTPSAGALVSMSDTVGRDVWLPPSSCIRSGVRQVLCIIQVGRTLWGAQVRLLAPRRSSYSGLWICLRLYKRCRCD